MGFFKDHSGGGGKDFLKLKGGESIQGVFRGDPYEFYSVFKDRTEYSQWAEGRSYRFRVNFVVNEGGQYKAKILEGGRRLQAQIEDEVKENGLNAVYRIKRTGNTKDDTTYSCVFLKKLSGEDLAKVEDVELESLTYGRSRKDTPGNHPAFDDDVPMPPEDDMPPEEDDEDLPF